MIDALPQPTNRNAAVRITKDAARQVRSGHPWVFASSITSISDGHEAGDLAVIFGEDRRFMAIGLYDPASPIAVKVLHHGQPRTIDTDFWRSRLRDALRRRTSLATSDHTNAYRVVHGENDSMPGFVLDRYASTVVVKLYSAAWFAHLRPVLDGIDDVLRPERIVLRLSRNVSNGPTYGLRDGTTVAGDGSAEVVQVREHDLVFGVNVVHGQKTGHFLDQRDNRAAVRDLAAGRSVLDVFSSTGGFSVHAADGAARSVHSVDLSPQSIAAAIDNMRANAVRPAVRRCGHDTTVGDAFVVMAELAARGRRFDMVVIDPPSFAQRQSQRAGALRAYARLTDAGLRLLGAGGILVQASCSSRIDAVEFYNSILRTAAGRGIDLREIARTGHAVDHPIGFAEGSYLKALFASV